MVRHPTLGFEIFAPPEDWIHVVVGDLTRPVAELEHAPEPLRSIREIVSSSNYAYAARRYLREMESKGMSPKQMVQLMNEPTPFSRIYISGEFAELPSGTALKAVTPSQERVCVAALHLARRRDVEGFRLVEPRLERPRMLFLPAAIEVAVTVVDCHHFVPAHLLPPGFGDLFEFGR
jgi:hypothetical protein